MRPTCQDSMMVLVIKSPKYWQLAGAGPPLPWTIGSCDKSNFPCKPGCRSKYYLHTAVLLYTFKVSPSLSCHFNIWLLNFGSWKGKLLKIDSYQENYPSLRVSKVLLLPVSKSIPLWETVQLYTWRELYSRPGADGSTSEQLSVSSDLDCGQWQYTAHQS